MAGTTQSLYSQGSDNSVASWKKCGPDAPAARPGNATPMVLASDRPAETADHTVPAR